MISINTLLIIIIVGLSFYAWGSKEVMNRWIMNPYTIKTQKQWYRFISSGFIHNDYMHLGFNCLTLYFFGDGIELIYSMGVLGKVAYPLFFVLGVIVSSIPTYLKHQSNPGYNSLGASGGVSSVVFASIVLGPSQELGLIIIPFFRLPAIIFGVMYLIYSHFMSKKGIDNINHDAHLYGALFGVLFTLLYVKGAIYYFLIGLNDLMNGALL